MEKLKLGLVSGTGTSSSSTAGLPLSSTTRVIRMTIAFGPSSTSTITSTCKNSIADKNGEKQKLQLLLLHYSS